MSIFVATRLLSSLSDDDADAFDFHVVGWYEVG